MRFLIIAIIIILIIYYFFIEHNTTLSSRERDLKKAEQIVDSNIAFFFDGTHKNKVKEAIMKLVIAEYDKTNKIISDTRISNIVFRFKMYEVLDKAAKIIDEKIKNDSISVDPIELKEKVLIKFIDMVHEIIMSRKKDIKPELNKLINEQKKIMEEKFNQIDYPYKQIPVRSALMNGTTISGLNAPIGYDKPLTNLWLGCRDRGIDCHWNGKMLQDPFNNLITGAPQTIQQPKPHDLTKPVNIQHIVNAGPLSCPPNHVITKFGINPENKLMYADCRKSNISADYKEFNKITSPIIFPDETDKHNLDRFYFNCPNGTALNSILPTASRGFFKFKYKCIT